MTQNDCAEENVAFTNFVIITCKRLTIYALYKANIDDIVT